jgi:hypothetical protein
MINYFKQLIPMMMIFIGASLGEIILGSINYCTLDNYSAEFAIPVWNLSFHIFYCSNVMKL